MAMSRSAGSRRLTTSPPSSTSPDVTVSRPATMRSKVDLPQPEGPTRTHRYPSGMAKLTSRTAMTPPPYVLLTARSATSTTSLLRLDQSFDEQPLHGDDDEGGR